MKVIVLGILLCIQAVCDLKWKRIPLWVTILGGIIGFVFMILEKRIEVIWSLVPGICSLIYSRISHEAMGYGDSFLLCMMGLYYSIEEFLLIYIVAFALAGIGAMVAMLFFHKKKNYEMAFVPFLLVAYLLNLFI